MLADRMMRGEEGSEFEARHGFSPDFLFFKGLFLSGLKPKLRGGKHQGNRGKPAGMHGCRAGQDDMPLPGISSTVFAGTATNNPCTAFSPTKAAEYSFVRARMGWGALNHGECGEILALRSKMFEDATCAPQKNNNPVQLMAGASRDMSWCFAPTSPGAAWGR
jgi:hypothetical protein